MRILRLESYHEYLFIVLIFNYLRVRVMKTLTIHTVPTYHRTIDKLTMMIEVMLYVAMDSNIWHTQHINIYHDGVAGYVAMCYSCYRRMILDVATYRSFAYF